MHPDAVAYPGGERVMVVRTSPHPPNILYELRFMHRVIFLFFIKILMFQAKIEQTYLGKGTYWQLITSCLAFILATGYVLQCF